MKLFLSGAVHARACVWVCVCVYALQCVQVPAVFIYYIIICIYVNAREYECARTRVWATSRRYYNNDNNNINICVRARRTYICRYTCICVCVWVCTGNALLAAATALKSPREDDPTMPPVLTPRSYRYIILIYIYTRTRFMWYIKSIHTVTC